MKIDTIPHVNNCLRTCSDCCGPVPFTEPEFMALSRKHRRLIAMKNLGEENLRLIKSFWVKGNVEKCVFSTPSGCEIYEKRPLVCRLFGASEQPRMQCPHGARADNPLGAKETAQMVRESILGNNGETYIS